LPALVTTKITHIACDTYSTYSTNKTYDLRLLPTFAGVLREKIRTRASSNKTPTNYRSEEGLINVIYDKTYNLKSFSFRKCLELVRSETTEVSSIEFIGYRMPPHKQNGCTVLFTRHQSTLVVGLFRYSDWLSRYLHLRLE